MNQARLRSTLKRHEGEVRSPYKDSLGIWTAGIGRNLSKGFSVDEVDLMFANDIQEAIHSLWILYPDIMENLTSVRQEILVNMTFNLGESRLAGFKRMWAALSQGDFYAASEEMLDSLWARQVGSRAVELSEAMRKGAWKS